MYLWLFGIIYGLQLLATLPGFIKTCKDAPYALYFLHHALDVFLFWGPLFLSKPSEFIGHFLFAIIVGIHWFTYGNRCILTVWMNRACGYAEDRWLDSLKNMTGLRAVNEYFHFIWVGALMVYDLWAGRLLIR